MQTLESLITSDPVGTIQADTFCAGCGYNLFSQAVIRDPNTEILMCRCPECGKFSPAGVATIADSGWRRAAGGLLIFFRAMILLFLLVMAGIFMGVIPYALAEEMIAFATYRISYYGSVADWQQQIMVMRIAYGLGAIVVGLAAALIGVVAFYHWRKRFYYIACLVPFLALVVAIAIWRLDHQSRPQYFLLQPIGMATTTESLLEHDYQYSNLMSQANSYRQQLQQLAPGSGNAATRAQLQADLTQLEKQLTERQELARQRSRNFRSFASPIVHMLAMTFLVIAGMVLGILFGRPVVRGLLRVLIPARALQPAAVLWFADNRIPPKPRERTASPATSTQ